MDDQEIIKAHYNSRANKSVTERQNTRNINIRNANNFIKTCLINKYIRRGDKVLDLGIGKGGDFRKYEKAGVSEIYGLDIANRSILDATARAREGQYGFKIILKTKDAFGTEFKLKRAFDVVSAQFSFHYSFQSESTLDTTLKNIDSHLNYDGYLIFTTLDKNEILRRKRENKLKNSYYQIEFKGPESTEIYGNAYYYTLVDSVDDCIEYLVDMDELVRKLNGYGFVLVENKSFGKFKALERSNNSGSYRKIANRPLDEEEESVFNLHIVVVFQKRK